MQRGIDKYQEYPITDPTRLELQIKIPAMARRHVPNKPRCFLLGRIRQKVVRVEPPTEPGLARYLVVSEAPYCSAPSESGVTIQPVCCSLDRVGHEHGRD